MSHFQTRVKDFFAIRENPFSRRPFGRGQLVGANGFMRLFDPTVKHLSAKKFAVLPFADWLVNQYIGKTQKISRKFPCHLPLFFSLYLPGKALFSALAKNILSSPRKSSLSLCCNTCKALWQGKGIYRAQCASPCIGNQNFDDLLP